MSTLHKQMAEHGIGVIHHFNAGVYIKETHIPAGKALGKHVHDFSHFSVLSKGDIVLFVDGERQELSGPMVLNIKAGSVHEVATLTDTVWLCIHATSETDPERVDASLVG